LSSLLVSILSALLLNILGVPPFNAEHPNQIFENILNRTINWPKVPETMSLEAFDLINRLLSVDPEERLGTGGNQSFEKDNNILN
jgi:serine/threonine protein kinase